MPKLLLYCCKAKPFLREYPFSIKERFYQLTEDNFNAINGKIVAECDFEVEEIIAQEYRDYYCTSINHLGDSELQKRSCLTLSQLCDYLGTKEYGSYELVKKVGYAIHIKNLHIFDKPKELSDYYTFNGIVNDVNSWKPIDKAPQNMMYAYKLLSELGLSGTCNMQLKKNIVISIRPEWLCKILNGEKTIEVRRKVLKEMLK